MKMRINRKNILMFLLSIMPLIDTINGIMVRDEGSAFNIGQLYRLTVLVLLFLLSAKMTNKLIVEYWGCFAAFMFVQFMVDLNYGVSSVVSTIKLFIPILLVTTVFSMIKRNKIKPSMVMRAIDVITTIIPLTIIVPYILKVGYRTYDDKAGYIGFYFASNEINFAISCCILICIHKLIIKTNKKTMALLALNLLAILLLGAKSGIVLAGICVAVYTVYGINKMGGISKKKIIMTIMIGLTVVFGLYCFRNNLAALIDRLMYINHIHSSENILYIMTSGRTSRIAQSISDFWSGSPIQILFGWGLGGINHGRINVEMDFLDLLYATGLIGFPLILYLYKKQLRDIAWDLWKSMSVLLAFVLIAFGGHVMFAGLGGMMLSVLLLYIGISPSSKKRQHQIKLTSL